MIEDNRNIHPVLVTRNLTKTFDNHSAIKDINLEINVGESLAILGPNGAGKTTLLKIMATVMRPSSGSLTICGLSVKDHPENIRRKIGIVAHHTYLYNNLTCFENLEFYCRMYDIPRGRIDEVMDLVDMRLRLHDRVATLSRGMQQRVSIARALLHNPAIIMLDEPETGLDQKSVSTLWNLIKGQQAFKRTLIMTTHNIANAINQSDRIIVLNRGQLVYDQPSNKLEIVEFKDTYDALTGVKK